MSFREFWLSCASMVVACLVACDVQKSERPGARNADAVAAELDKLTENFLRMGYEGGEKRLFRSDPADLTQSIQRAVAAAEGRGRLFDGQATSHDRETETAAKAARSFADQHMPHVGFSATQRGEAISGLALAFGFGYAAALKGYSYALVRDRQLDSLQAAVRSVAGR